MRSIIILFILAAVVDTARGQIIEPDRRPLRKDRIQSLVRALATSRSLSRGQTIQYEDSVREVFEQKLTDDQIKFRLTPQIAGLLSSTPAEADTVIEQTRELGDTGPSGGVAVTTEGNLKTNIQAYRFVISERTLKIPMYFTIGPEVLLANGTESEESKARKIVDLTGGNLGVALKRYFGLLPKSIPDVSLRTHLQLAGNFTTNQDSANVSSVSGGTIQAAAGLTFEASISGDGTGFIWLEGSVGNTWFAGESQRKVFAVTPATSFPYASIVGRLLVFGLLDIQAHYYKAWNSSIKPLDNGFGMVTFGVSTALRGQ